MRAEMSRFLPTPCKPPLDFTVRMHKYWCWRDHKRLTPTSKGMWVYCAWCKLHLFPADQPL
jgi:hypothetical protein